MNQSRRPEVVHALLSLESKTTVCGDTPPRGLVVAQDHQVAWFLSSVVRCERCRVELHLHLDALKAANAQRLAAERAATRPAVAPPVPSARDLRRAAQAKAARDRSIEQYTARSRAHMPSKGSP